jgi:hypothetical protein
MIKPRIRRRFARCKNTLMKIYYRSKTKNKTKIGGVSLYIFDINMA